MIKYITVFEEAQKTLTLMGRKKTFTSNTEVNEDIYTKAYPQYFKRIGEVTGVIGYLNTPVFVRDSIDDFLRKEEVRAVEKPKEKETILPKEVKIDELVEASKEFNSDVKIEIEEDK